MRLSVLLLFEHTIIIIHFVIYFNSICDILSKKITLTFVRVKSHDFLTVLSVGLYGGTFRIWLAGNPHSGQIPPDIGVPHLGHKADEIVAYPMSLFIFIPPAKTSLPC